jgi:uncharacterized protein (DUF2062 family)
MRRHRLFKRLPTPQSLKESRFLKPFAHYLHHHSLWQFNRRAVAGGVAIGLFFGILVPFAQIFLAAIAAVILRVNLPTAAFCTLITNPLTFPPIYYVAYRLGSLLTGGRDNVSETVVNADINQVVAVQKGNVMGWFPSLVDWLQTVGLPLTIGLATLATLCAVIGYFAVSAIWSLHIRQRWQRRRSHRS